MLSLLFCSLCLLHFSSRFSLLFFFNDSLPTDIYTLSLHDALPISFALRNWRRKRRRVDPSALRQQPVCRAVPAARAIPPTRSEEHTSELQSRFDLVCRLLLEKKKKKKIKQSKYNRIITPATIIRTK